MDLFVGNKYMHTFFRATAILFGIYIYLAGVKYNDIYLKIIGALTIIVDSFTFSLSILKIMNNDI